MLLHNLYRYQKDIELVFCNLIPIYISHLMFYEQINCVEKSINFFKIINGPTLCFRRSYCIKKTLTFVCKVANCLVPF